MGVPGLLEGGADPSLTASSTPPAGSSSAAAGAPGGAAGAGFEAGGAVPIQNASTPDIAALAAQGRWLVRDASGKVVGVVDLAQDAVTHQWRLDYTNSVFRTVGSPWGTFETASEALKRFDAQQLPAGGRTEWQANASGRAGVVDAPTAPSPFRPAQPRPDPPRAAPIQPQPTSIAGAEGAPGVLETGLTAAARSVAVAVAIGGGAAGLVVGGVLAAPVVAGLAVGASVVFGLRSFFDRASEGLDAGTEDWFGRAVVSGASGAVPGLDVVQMLEAAYGYNYMTGEELTPQQRAEMVGGMAGSGAMAGVARGLSRGRTAAPDSDGPGGRGVGDFLEEVADTFADALAREKARRPKASVGEQSTRAHEETQAILVKRHGDAVGVEQPLGVTHPGVKPAAPGADLPWHEGARGDVHHNGLKALVEMKATAWVKDGGLQTPFKRPDQTLSLEIFADSNPGWSVHVVDGKGRIFSYFPGWDIWIRMR